MLDNLTLADLQIIWFILVGVLSPDTPFWTALTWEPAPFSFSSRAMKTEDSH